MATKTNPEDQGYFAKLMGRAQTILSSASDAHLNVILFDTLQEFFADSNSWREVIPFSVVPSLQDYPIAPQSGRIERLIGVTDQNQISQSAIMPNIGTVTFLYPYSNAQPMWALVAKNVTNPLSDCFPEPPDKPDWLLPKYGLGILSGILGNMMNEPGQAYSNEKGAAFHLARFRNSIQQARAAAMRGNTVGTQAWRFPQSFRTFGQRGGVSTGNVNPPPRTQ